MALGHIICRDSKKLSTTEDVSDLDTEFNMLTWKYIALATVQSDIFTVQSDISFPPPRPLLRLHAPEFESSKHVRLTAELSIHLLNTHPCIYQHVSDRSTWNILPMTLINATQQVK